MEAICLDKHDFQTFHCIKISFYAQSESVGYLSTRFRTLFGETVYALQQNAYYPYSDALLGLG